MATKQRKFITDWCGSSQYGSFDACSEVFHEQFHQAFGGVRHEKLWGAQMVPKAMRLAERMVDEGILERSRIGLTEMRGLGYPAWVWSYRLTT